MSISVGAKTDVGLKRPHNEDDLCVDPEVGLYVVCDGLGGRNAGEVASRLAVEVIQKHVREAWRDANLPMVGSYDRQFSPLTHRLGRAVPLAQGDALLLCSDGLTRGVKPAAILDVVRRERDPQAAAERLVKLANAAGGLDNTTVILVSVRHGAGETPMRQVWNWRTS